MQEIDINKQYKTAFGSDVQLLTTNTGKPYQEVVGFINHGSTAYTWDKFGNLSYAGNEYMMTKSFYNKIRDDYKLIEAS